MIKLNGHQIIPTIFPDQTSQIWHIPDSWIKPFEQQEVVWEFSYEGEFLHLAQLKTLLDSTGLVSNLYMPYLPYARQDKVVSNNTTFALRTFCQLLSSLGFSKISALDPHSILVLKDYFYNFDCISSDEYIQKVINLTKPDLPCYPDSGAVDRYNKVYKFFPYNFNNNYLWGQKVRNQETGEIINYAVYQSPTQSYKDKKILIIDDICDGGKTFCMLAERLKASGAIEINLFVTHGIFSKGLKVLRESGINRIFTHKGEAFEEQRMIVYKEFE